MNENLKNHRYAVQVIKKDNGEIVKQIECDSYDAAVKTERGLNINLYHKDYETEIVGI